MSLLSELTIKSPDLCQLREKWQLLGIVEEFREIHHSSRVPNSLKRETLYGFIKYCDQVEFRKENHQTLERALKFASLRQVGAPFKEALESAWASYPRIGSRAR